MNIVVGVTGGIAAYKAVGVIRTLVLAGHDVHVIATQGALRFVGAATFEAVSRNLLNTDLYEGVAGVRHVALGQAADLVIITPATANSIAKIAAGIADDLLGTTILATKAPVVIAPAMHTEMWQNAATVANIAVLSSRGVTIVGPAVGQLTGTDSGVGRMAEPEEIVAVALATIRRRDLIGKRILITAGGTREPLDPVRFIGNRSSGRQGVALAIAAIARGADVTLIAANLEVAVPSSLRVNYISSTLELAEAVTAAAPAADVVIMNAAVADYRPEQVSQSKIKKEQHGERITLELVRNPDILAGLDHARLPGQVIIGFAAETEPERQAMLEIGRAKIGKKGCDFLVVNRVGWSEGFGTDTNTVVVIDRLGAIVIEASGSKQSVADSILDVLA